jgi:hypothetical protein
VSIDSCGNGNHPTHLSAEALTVPERITDTELAGFAASRALRT